MAKIYDLSEFRQKAQQRQSLWDRAETACMDVSKNQFSSDEKRIEAWNVAADALECYIENAWNADSHKEERGELLAEYAAYLHVRGSLEDDTRARSREINQMARAALDSNATSTLHAYYDDVSVQLIELAMNNSEP